MHCELIREKLPVKMGPRLCLLLSAAALALVAHAVVAAGASTELQSISPREGQRVSIRARPTFKVRIAKGKVAGEADENYAVFIRVSTSGKKHALEGAKPGDPRIIGGDRLVARMRPAGGANARTFTFTPRRYSHTEYWLRKGGTYYWQAYYIYCIDDRCVHPSRVKKLRVR